MASLSACIAPFAHVDANATPIVRTWSFEDTSTVIYPRGIDGRSMRVVIIRRLLTSNTGCRVSVCRNGGKWSFKIQRPFATKPTAMTKDRFASELQRMGIGAYLGDLIDPVYRPMAQ